MLGSSFLKPLKSGAEACPFADESLGIVYKLFPLHVSGGLGKTFEIETGADGRGFEMTVRDAVLFETMEKLMVLHDAGGHPTEIVGLDAQGEYLIIKQPLAGPYLDLEQDREKAVKRLKAVPCRAMFRRPVWIIWDYNQAWIVSDLHSGNIMRDGAEKPCIIDALLAPIPNELMDHDHLLYEDILDAKSLREGGVVRNRDRFAHIRDDEL
jgi:hypothetical protein